MICALVVLLSSTRHTLHVRNASGACWEHQHSLGDLHMCRSEEAKQHIAMMYYEKTGELPMGANDEAAIA